MSRSPRAAAAAIALATLWIGFDPGSAAAECFPRVAEGTPLAADFAFTARVTAVSTEPDEKALAAGEGVGSTWRVELAVGHVYRGEVPGASLVWEGYTLRHLACNNDLLGERLRVGEQLFIAIEDQFGLMTGPEALSAEPRPYGRLLLWQRVGDRWRFYTEALADDAGEAGPYPRPAREASTTPRILDVISGRVPDTATEPTPRPDPGLASTADRLAFFAIIFGIALRIVRPRRPRPEQRPCRK